MRTKCESLCEFGVSVLFKTIGMLLLSLSYVESVELPEGCNITQAEGVKGDVYCQGSLLATAFQLNMNEMYPSDKKLRRKPTELLTAWTKFQEKHPEIESENFAVFCAENFNETADYVVNTFPPDFVPKPANLRKIKDGNLRKFALKVHNVWPKLYHKFVGDVTDNPDLYPVVRVPNPFMVPAQSTFQIYFYWDSYWINKGLLFSNMTTTVRKVLLNFKSMIEKLGHIGNYGNICAARRSQPPLYTQMVADWFNETNDKETLIELMPSLLKEMEFWETERSYIVRIREDEQRMFRYRAETNCPRSESYGHDLDIASRSSNPPGDVYRNLASACESGWDFSSRWFQHNVTNEGSCDISTIKTIDILPVDLNAFMCMNYASLAHFCQKIGNNSCQKNFERKHQQMKGAIQKVFWNDTDGVWFDYDLRGKIHRRRWYPSNISPLFANCYPTENASERHQRIGEYLQRTGVLDHPGGVPTSLVSTGQQWDFPNGWPPLMHMMVMALRKTNSERLQQMAANIARKFISTAYRGFMQPPEGQQPAMWEKYDVRTTAGTKGSGGEYKVVPGFGWTNGAVLDILFHYGDVLTAPEEQMSGSKMSTLSAIAVAILYTVLIGFLLW